MARRFFNRQGRGKAFEYARRTKRQSRQRNKLNRAVDLGLESLEPRWVMAAPGTLDTTFDGDGIRFDNFAAGRDEEIEAVVVQSDGKIVTAGLTRPAGNTNQGDVAITRYYADGTRDPSFGTGGVTVLAVSAGTGLDFSMDLAIDGSGRIVVGGAATVSFVRNFMAIRLTASGSVDTTFGGGNGIALTSLVDSGTGATHAQVNGIALQGDGKIVLGGWVEKPGGPGQVEDDFVLVRYDSSGNLDSTFGTGGIVLTDFTTSPGNPSSDQLNDIAIQSDGRIVAVGTANPLGGPRDFGIARYNTDGTLDTTFGTGGKVVTAFSSGLIEIAQAVAIEADGQIVVVGSASNGANTSSNFALARYNTNGTLDTSLNASPASSQLGTSRFNFPFRTTPSNPMTEFDFNSASSLVIMPDGDYILAGTIAADASGLSDSFGLARVNPNGTIDTNFGFDLPGGIDEHGFVRTSFSGTDLTKLTNVVLQPNGFLVAAGWTRFTATNHDMALARYDLDLGIPPLADAGGPYPLNEPGDSVVLTGSGAGSGTLSYAWDLDGDANFGETGAGALNGDEASQTVTYTATGLDGPSAITVSLRVTSAPSGLIATDTATINIVNVAPTLAISGVAAVDEGSSYILDLSSSDPGSDTITSWTINWGDGIEFVSDNPTSVTHTYADGDANYVVSATATDEDGTFAASNTVAVMVHNVDPTLAISGAAAVDEGSSYILDLSSSDPGSDTITSWTINWGDGTQIVAGNPTSATHTYADGDANYVISATATDEDGTFAAGNTVAVMVNNVAPTANDVTYTLAENSPNGTLVGSVTANDPGADTLTFSIAGGTGAAAFSIDSAGQITVADASLLDFETSPTLTLEIEVADGDGGVGTALATINLLNQASISGVVFVDVNQNGSFDANEPGIDGVVIKLLDEFGNPVLDGLGDAITAITNSGGFYLFEDLDPGIYQLFEMQPTGVTDGAEVLGSLGGTMVANDRLQLTLAQADAFDYAFAEIGQQLGSGDTATIGFWQNKHGQALITQGGAQLAAWLTTNFSNIFGNALVGASGSDVASFYRDQLFKQQGKKSAGPAKVDAQFMAVALATFFTSQTLAGQVALSYGFNVTDTGIGTKIVNVGTKGAAFDVANGTDRTILQLLAATDDQTDQPNSLMGFAAIYDVNGDGAISADEAMLRTMANGVFSSINEAGDI